MSELNFAFNMSSAITEPGKAMARGYAAQEIFGEHAAIAQVFFERAFNLGGKDVKPEASVNTFEDADSEFENIPINEQPASRRKDAKVLNGNVSRRTPWANLVSLGKLNIIKGTGPQFKLYDYPSGTVEVWEDISLTIKGRYRLIYTSHYESVYFIDELRKFKYADKLVEWKLVDYIESEFVANLAPVYGKSIMIFNYD